MSTVGSNEDKARKLLDEAKKKISASRGFLGVFFGDGSYFDDAADLYKRAGAHFTMAGNHPEAYKAFEEAAKLQLSRGSKHEAASSYVSAANSLKKFDVPKAISSLKNAVDLYAELGRFSMAAKYNQSVAELLEEIGDYVQAVQHYEDAAEYYFGEGSKFCGNKCVFKVAIYSAEIGEYDKAINLFERIIVDCLNSDVLKNCANDHFFRATLCHLCIDVTNAQRALERYSKLYPAFANSRYFNFLRKIIDNVDYQDIEGFTVAAKDFDAVSRLDNWTTTILLRIKKDICCVPNLR